MRITLADRTRLASSPIREIFQQIPAVNNERVNMMGLDPVMDLTIGQPHIPMNPTALGGIRTQLQEIGIERHFGYSPIPGRVDTLEAITQFYSQSYPTVSYGVTEVICTNGANQALWNAFSILIQEKNGVKDKVLIFEPYFGQYHAQIAALGGQLICIPTSKNAFKPTARGLDEALKKNQDTKAIVFSYPNNPSGVSLTIDELNEIANVLAKYPAVALILDEVYRSISFIPHLSLLDIDPSFKERTIVICSGSKGLIGAPDLRIGMAAAPAEWIKAMSHQQTLTTASVSYLSQVALTHSIKARSSAPSREWEQTALLAYRACVDAMYHGLMAINLPPAQKPDGGFFVLANASSLLGRCVPDEISITTSMGTSVVIKNIHSKIGTKQLRTDVDIAAYFLHVAGVATVPGSGFGIDWRLGYLRLSCAMDKTQIERAIQKLAQACIQIRAFEKAEIFAPSEIEKVITEKNIAIIGMGNIGEWIAYMLLMDIADGKLTQINKVYFLGRDKEKLEAKVSDQLHALIIEFKQKNKSIIDLDKLIEKIEYSDDYAVLQSTSVIITAFGAPMTPEIKERSDLLLANDRIAVGIGAKIKTYAPKNTILINLTNPLDMMTWRLQEASGLPKNHVLGVSGILDISRFAQAIHDVLRVKYEDIELNRLFVCGEHGPSMVPLLSHAMVLGEPLLSQISAVEKDEILAKTASKGTRMMEALGKIPPHVGTAQATIIVLRAIFSATPVELICSTWSEEYQGFLSLPVVISENCIQSISPPVVSVDEKRALQQAADKIKLGVEQLRRAERRMSVLSGLFFANVPVSEKKSLSKNPELTGSDPCVSRLPLRPPRIQMENSATGSPCLQSRL